MLSRKNAQSRPSLYFGMMLLLLAPLFLASCEDQRVQTITWVEYEPVYMSEDEFMNSVTVTPPKDLEIPGKIYFYQGYLFVNERNKGIHIIDNLDPSNPVNIGFISIPATKDLAVKGELLYADSQKDLLIFDISNLQNPELIERVEDVFNTAANIAPGFTTQQIDDSKGLVVDWKEVVREEICEGNCQSHPQWAIIQEEGVFFDTNSGVSSESGSGIGGSLARFAINGDYLYAVDYTDLITFDIATDNTDQVSQSSVGWAIETIFPYNDNLFIGSEQAMYIYHLENPANPQQLSIYWHATACDPIVVEGDYAFVTLRQSERCPQGENRLEVVNVSDLTSPYMVNFYEMKNPHGLGIDNGKLFVSEGEFGLKIMDATNPLDIKLLRHIEDIETYDVIPFNNVLMVTGDDGIIQYDYSDINELVKLSTIPVFGDHDEAI